ncbi:MAG: exodeoxyribonuclease VII large subunit [Gammaproteobacteria bacterium]|nr:exodeoxyribonuclease VII large subunit [Gammaproteobacteria bacterium]
MYPPADPLSSQQRDIYSVSRLNHEARSLLEGSFPLLWIEGEVSNLTRHSSGHWYFSLKDEAAQVRCAMFRNRNMYVGFTPSNGIQVLLRARISLYEARGEFQIIAEYMEESGEGALRRAFDLLKQRLQSEGLFNAQHKKPLPYWPYCVGVITSPTGAAIHDIVTTLQRRLPLLPVIVYPVPVQGKGSAEQIAAMITTAASRRECDVIILARGGGSLEDLWAFNEESVARAIYHCPIPIVTGIGHEIDFSIADFVADQRAPTPTAAAELVSPNQHEITTRLQQYADRLVLKQQARLQHWQQQLQWLSQRLPHPMRQLQLWMQRLDELQLRQQTTLRYFLQQQQQRVQQIQQRLYTLSPMTLLSFYKQRLTYAGELLYRTLSSRLQQSHHALNHLVHALDTVSPLATLQRGYAIVTRGFDQSLVRHAAQVQPGEAILVRLAQSSLECQVQTIKTEPP